MNVFDKEIIESLNNFSSSHYLLLVVNAHISGNELLKGGIIVAMIWWVWWKESDGLIANDLFSVRTLLGAFLAVGVGRLAQNMLPMRLRPVHNPEFDFTVVEDVFKTLPLEGWSSFPSDHAVLFFALATAIFTKSRSVGIFFFAWSLFVICLPRVFLGLHYPTDIVAGALLGILIMYFSLTVPLPASIGAFLKRLETRYPAPLYAIVFLVSFQIATLFDGARQLTKGGIELLSIVIRAYT